LSSLAAQLPAMVMQAAADDRESVAGWLTVAAFALHPAADVIGLPNEVEDWSRSLAAAGPAAAADIAGRSSILALGDHINLKSNG
jgi:hypothetical protein